MAGANDHRQRQIAIGGLIEDNPLTSGATTLTSAALAAVAGGITSTQYMAIVLDPDGVDGAPEIAHITALTSGAGSATIERGMEGTTARQHAVNTPWIHAPLPLDVPLVKRKSATQSVVSSTTLVNDTELFFPIAANETWVAQFHLYTDGGGFVTGDLKVAFTVPAGATVIWSVAGADPTTDTNYKTTHDTSSFSTVAITSTGGYVNLTISVVNSTTAGNVQFQFAQRASDANSSDVLAGSWLVAHRI